jgi:hypothetical protein
MSLWGTVRAIGEAVGVWDRRGDLGCVVGQQVFRETKRAAVIANVLRPRRPLRPATQAMLRELFPDLDVAEIRVRERCRLPANKFSESGSIYAMTLGTTIYFRDVLDEDDPKDLVQLIHEAVHVDQVRRHGGESGFACAYGRGYIEGGGEVQPRFGEGTAYHRNPLEAEAYAFDARFRDDRGRVVSSRLPTRPH